MRKNLFLLFMLFSIGIFAARTSDNKDKSTAKDLILDKGESMDHDLVRPRSVMPFACVYSDGALQLTLLGEVGEFTLTVTNRATGECWSVSNALYLKTSSAAGTYSVQIVTEDGTSYYGTYTL